MNLDPAKIRQLSAAGFAASALAGKQRARINQPRRAQGVLDEHRSNRQSAIGWINRVVRQTAATWAAPAS